MLRRHLRRVAKCMFRRLRRAAKLLRRRVAKSMLRRLRRRAVSMAAVMEVVTAAATVAVMARDTALVMAVMAATMAVMAVATPLVMAALMTIIAVSAMAPVTSLWIKS